ncbi:ABC-2 transporter permease [Austwickia chelonae]|uniref:ABC-2 transporter permease n=1 Tax=Austwickia chelonae TaxID=100225 RepID=UPI000E24EC6E|nr:ABC-2 transporter permease [Austwickia chelonae]
MSNRCSDLVEEQDVQRSATGQRIVAMIHLDILTIREALIQFLLLVLATSVIAVIHPVDAVIAAMAALAAITIIKLLAAIDENNLHLLYGSLPALPHEVVAAHYALGAGVVALSSLPAILMSIRSPQSDLATAAGIAANCTMLLVALSLLLPVYIRWGTRRGSTVLLSGALLIGAILLFVPGVLHDAPLAPPPEIINLLSAAAILLGVTAYLASCAVAARVYSAMDH